MVNEIIKENLYNYPVLDDIFRFCIRFNIMYLPSYMSEDSSDDDEGATINNKL
jgi:Lhr-like helicase